MKKAVPVFKRFVRKSVKANGVTDSFVMITAAPEVIAIEETVGIGEGKEVGTIPTETDLTDMNSPVAETDPTELTVQIKWIESNVLTVRTVGIAPSDLTVPAADAIDQSEIHPSLPPGADPSVSNQSARSVSFFTRAIILPVISPYEGPC